MLTRNTPLQRRTQLRTHTRMPSRRREPRALGLGHQIAQANGTAAKHARREPSVFRSLGHLQLVASLACVACGRQRHSQAAHLNLLALGKGRGLKTSDAFTVPLCAPDLGLGGCHWMLDQSGRMSRDASELQQLEWLGVTRTVLDLRGLWPDAAEADYQRIVVPYLLRCA